MLRKINIGEQEVAYAVIKKRRTRRVCISVSRGGKVRVTIPWFVSIKIGEQFLREKIAWIEEKLRQLPPRLNSTDFHRYKARAKALVHRKLKEFAPRYGMHYHKVSVRNQSSRWGSCSKAGNLNFNFKLIFLDEPLVDYVIVHELCHLKEFNHSVNFWKLVAETVPDYRRRRAELKAKKL